MEDIIKSLIIIIIIGSVGTGIFLLYILWLNFKEAEKEIKESLKRENLK